MKNSIIFFGVNLILIITSLLLSVVISELGVTYLFLVLSAVVVYYHESRRLRSSLFESMVLLVSIPLFIVIVFYGYEPFFLFSDDEYYYLAGKSQHLRSFNGLINSFLFEEDLDFNNYLYIASVFFKLFGYHQFVYVVVNFICLIRILSFISEAKTENKKMNILRWMPLELILFTFFCFKDILLCFVVTEYVRNTVKANLLIYVISSVLLVVIVEPLRVGYSSVFIFVIGIVKFTNFLTFLRKIPIIISIWGLFLLVQVSLATILAITEGGLSYKIYYYVQSLIARVAESSGFLSIFYNAFNSGNIFYSILIVCFTVFIPILTVPANFDNSYILFMICRFISLLQYLLLLLRVRNLDFRYSQRKTVVAFLFVALTVIHLNFAPGMLRHTLIILPFMYSLLISVEHEKKITSLH